MYSTITWVSYCTIHSWAAVCRCLDMKGDSNCSILNSDVHTYRQILASCLLHLYYCNTVILYMLFLKWSSWGKMGWPEISHVRCRKRYSKSCCSWIPVENRPSGTLLFWGRGLKILPPIHTPYNVKDGRVDMWNLWFKGIMVNVLE